MTIQPSPYDLVRAIQDQQRATDRLVQMLVGMLDKSGPEPLLSGGPIAAPQVRRISEEAARPGETIEIDGKAVHTTKRRAKLLTMVMSAPMTLSAMARAGVSPTVAGMKAQIRDTNTDLERAGVTPAGGEVATIATESPSVADEELPKTADDAAGFDSRSLAEDRCDDGSNPSAAADIGAVADRGGARRPDGGERPATISDLAPASAAAEARPPEVVAPPQPPAGDVSAPKGERVLDLWANTNFSKALIAEKAGCAPASVSAFVSIAKAKGDPRAIARTPEALATRRAVEECPAPPPEPALPSSPIEPGDLIAVDVKLRRVSVGPNGGYETATVQMARALDLLKSGQMFGLDKIATRAGWQSAEVARNALLLERNRLSQRGVELYLDKFNARLREAS